MYPLCCPINPLSHQFTPQARALRHQSAPSEPPIHPLSIQSNASLLTPVQTNHQSPVTNHQSPVTVYHSPFTVHRSPSTNTLQLSAGPHLNLGDRMPLLDGP
eukprot:5190674-Pyramimonas_sp.AAC.2